MLVPVAAKVTAVPLMAFPFASFKVMVTIEVDDPLAVTELGEAAIVEVPADGAPGTNVTDPVTPVNPAGVAMLRVFASATVDFIVAVA